MQLTIQLGSIIATMVLARVLAPEQFGVIAVVQSLLGAAALLNLAGITASLVSRKGPVERAAASYFWAALFVGMGVLSLFWLLADPLVRLMAQPDAAQYVRALAVTFPLTLLAMVPQAILQRRMAFTALNTSAVISASLYFGSEIALALAGWGVWAVVIGQIIGAAAALVMSFGASRWVPRHGFHLDEIRQDLGLLGGLGASRLFSYAQKNVDYWVISATIGAVPLGVYYIAYALPNIIRLRLSEVFRTVMLPVVAREPDLAIATVHWQRATTTLLVMGMPALTGLAALAAPLTLLFFGPQWESAVVPMQILAIATVADLLMQAVGTMAVAQRRVARHTAVLGLRAALTAAFVGVAAWRVGTLTSVAVAVAAAALVTLSVQELAVSRPLGVGLAPLKRTILTTCMLCCTMFLVVAAVLSAIQDHAQGPASHAAIQVILGTITGGVTYLGVGMLVAKPSTLSLLVDIKQILMGR
jgi:PST family polysaccharide transporter